MKNEVIDININIYVTQPMLAPADGTDLVIFTDVKNYVPERDNRGFLIECKKYAKRFRVHLVTCRIIAGGYLCLFLIDDTGNVQIAQRASHLNLSYRGIFERATDLNVTKTKFGNIFLAVDVDILHPEVIRCAALAGANLIISSQFIPLYDYIPARNNYLRSLAASNDVFIINATNFNTSIVSPTEFLVKENETIPLYCSLDADIEKHKVTDNASFLRLRYDLYKKYAEQIEG